MTDLAPRIRFCVNNPHSLTERNELLARGYECLGCLGNCNQCFETRFLEIDGGFIAGDSYEQILRRARGEAGSDDGAKKTPREDRGASKDTRSDDRADA